MVAQMYKKTEKFKTVKRYEIRIYLIGDYRTHLESLRKNRDIFRQKNFKNIKPNLFQT